MTNDKPESGKPTGRRDRTVGQLSATAYHKAGHAFADWKFHFKIKQLTIVPGDGVWELRQPNTFSFVNWNTGGSMTAKGSGVTMIELSRCLRERKHSGGSIQKASENTMAPATMIR